MSNILQWDLKTIVDTGIVPWAAEALSNVRYAFIVPDSNATSTLPGGYEYYLSDGTTYNNSTTTIHTWDRSKDKVSGKGYSTRCVVVCKSADRDVSVSARAFSLDGLTMGNIYFGDCNITRLLFGAAAATAGYLLQSVDYSDVTTINGTAFAAYTFTNCVSLRELTVPSGVTTLLQQSLGQCSALHTLTLPSTLTTIADDAIYSCSALQVINLPQDFSLSLSLTGTIGGHLSITSLDDMAAKYADMTSQTSPTLTIGAANIAKISSETLGIFASKNITLV